MDLLERAGHLATLVDQLRQVDDAGRLVLISGEAGAGKSALVQTLCEEHLDGGRVLVGRCDDLFAPRPLGPLADIARGRPGPLSEALRSGDQASAFDAFLAELAAPPHPTVVVLEDLQWADEATLDLLRFVARRLDGLPCLILATHRDDLAADHLLRRAAGSLVGPLVSRVHLPPLSVDGVRTLVGGRGLDPVSLHARTGGNPFFLVEVLAGGQGGERDALPATVRDAILARAALLSGSARDALDAAAVLGRQVGADLLQAVGGCDGDDVDECLAAGLLVDEDGHQAFRHDLSRQAVAEAMTPRRRRQLHARALEALGDDGDVVQRAHHAVGAGDRVAIVGLATSAADQCVALGAFRQAASLYGQALEHADGMADTDRRRLLEARARTCERVERLGEAITAGEELLTRLAEDSDERARGDWECWLGSVYRSAGRTEEAWRVLRAAVSRLEPLGESPELARALAMLAQQHLVSGHSPDTIAHGRRARAMAERFGVEEVAVHAMDSYGTAMGCVGDSAGGIDVLGEALDRAKKAGIAEEVTRITANLAEILIVSYQPARAVRLLDHGIAVATEHDLRFNRNGLLIGRAEVLMLLARWDEALADTGAVLAEVDLSPTNRCVALQHLGRMRARRGDPGAFDALDEALALALPSTEVQLIHPVLIARAEAAWLAGDPAQAAREVEAAMPLCDGHPDHPWRARELALWAHRTGVDWNPIGPVPDPSALMVAGEAAEASAFWAARSCPYEAADALGESDDVDDLRQALERLTALGARPRALQVSRRLRERGARDVPRGPRASTRANAAGLTAREVEVAALLVEGLTNGDIAERLVVSPKTVDHHVSAVLSKLAVRNRRHVAKAAADLGLDLQDGVIAAAT